MHGACAYGRARVLIALTRHLNAQQALLGYKLRAHAHRHGGSMGTYGTSQGGGAWGGGLGGVPPI